jgi:hypothetical protein
MKPSPSKTTKAADGKKRGHEEAAGSAAGTSLPVSPPRPDPNREWKKSKAKTEDLLDHLNSGFLQEKEVDMWRAAAGDPYPMEKNLDEIPMFARFAERGLSLPVSDFFKGLLGYYCIEYLNLNPNGIFHTAVFVHFLQSLLGDQAPLDLVLEVLLCEAATQRQQSLSSRRSRDSDEGGCRRAIPLLQIDRFQSRLESQVVLCHEPPPGAAEAQWEAAQAQAMVELGADDARRSPVA